MTRTRMGKSTAANCLPDSKSGWLPWALAALEDLEDLEDRAAVEPDAGLALRRIDTQTALPIRTVTPRGVA